MYFTTFSVASTNIFPLSNSKYGGQLATEYYLRAREMVATPAVIEYEVGPSFVHSASDFEVKIQQDSTGAIISPATLEIAPGRAVVNGHYVQTFTPMIVDMLEANATAKANSMSPLKGELEIGIRAFYSTEPTMAGSMLVDNEYEMYMGVQLVILPKVPVNDGDETMITPMDSPTDRSKVNAHIKLASFTFLNGAISDVRNYSEDKLKYISAERIENIEKMISADYVTKTGLNPNKFYTFVGKYNTPDSGQDTWCDTTSSLLDWGEPSLVGTKPSISKPTFADVNNSGQIQLVLPRKQITSKGLLTATGTAGKWFDNVTVPFPVADYASNKPGTVDKKFISNIKDINNKLTQFHQIVKGKQVYYLATKDADTTLPPINANWEVGDYILVGEDYTAEVNTDGVRAPSTMYVVIPGVISSIKYKEKSTSDAVPSSITGVQLGAITLDKSKGDSVPSTSADPTTYPTFYQAEDLVRGSVGKDYFVATYIEGETYTKYYYVVETADARTYSNHLFLTGEIPLAQESVIGGFYNVPTDNSSLMDAGYIYRDEHGHLRLLDYALLRSGTLAYQLGEDITLPSGITTEEIQAYLEEYVNQRIAFPNANQLENSTTPNVININITLPAEESPVTLNIYDLDSRFNTAVCINILGKANSNTTINIIDCEKIRINSYIEGSPVINIYRSCLYYDASIIDYIRTCPRSDITFKGLQDIKLWYARYDETDPNLLVDNMTVSELDAPIISTDIDFWSTTSVNDNHYKYALSSITFSGTGEIIRCRLLVANESTDNIDIGNKIITSSFELPQGAGLIYPKSSMTKQLKITGTFVSAYNSDNQWRLTDTLFTAITSVYDEFDLTATTKGNIAFHSNTMLIPADESSDPVIPGWETNTYHMFEGGAIG